MVNQGMVFIDTTRTRFLQEVWSHKSVPQLPLPVKKDFKSYQFYKDKLVCFLRAGGHGRDAWQKQLPLVSM